MFTAAACMSIARGWNLLSFFFSDRVSAAVLSRFCFSLNFIVSNYLINESKRLLIFFVSPQISESQMCGYQRLSAIDNRIDSSMKTFVFYSRVSGGRFDVCDCFTCLLARAFWFISRAILMS